MNHQEDDQPAGMRTGEVLRRRKLLITLAGGAVMTVLVLAGCEPNASPPTPTATSGPSPWATPSPAASTNAACRDDAARETSQEGACAALESSTIAAHRSAPTRSSGR